MGVNGVLAQVNRRGTAAKASSAETLPAVSWSISEAAAALAEQTSCTAAVEDMCGLVTCCNTAATTMVRPGVTNDSIGMSRVQAEAEIAASALGESSIS